MRRVALLLFISAGVFAVLFGCVERKLSIKSSPSNARLYVDYDLRGRTPDEMEFTHYGTRFVRLEKAGFQTRLSTVKLEPTWYSYFPINFVTEVLLPYTIEDHRTRHFELTPFRLPAEIEERPDIEKRKEVQKRAEELKKQLPSQPSESGSNSSSDQ